jgi:hypothetical protein
MIPVEGTSRANFAPQLPAQRRKAGSLAVSYLRNERILHAPTLQVALRTFQRRWFQKFEGIQNQCEI